jgi:hypothetical protein
MFALFKAIRDHAQPPSNPSITVGQSGMSRPNGGTNNANIGSLNLPQTTSQPPPEGFDPSGGETVRKQIS